MSLKFPVIFEKDKFPTIMVYKDYFEIKAIDYWEFRKFDLKSVESLIYYNPNNLWYNRLFFWSWQSALFKDLEPSILKVNLKDGGNWKYSCPNKIDKKLSRFLFWLNGQINQYRKAHPM